MENPQTLVHPTVKPDTGLKVKVPSTPEGREFLEKLKQLLAVEELPFEKVCSSGQEHPKTQLEGNQSAPSDISGSTTYTLDLRLEQEGWAP